MQIPELSFLHVSVGNSKLHVYSIIIFVACIRQAHRLSVTYINYSKLILPFFVDNRGVKDAYIRSATVDCMAYHQ